MASVAAAELELNEEERTWLESHPEIKLGIDPEWAPFEYRDSEGLYSGMASGYVQLLSRRLGVELRTEEGLSWTEVIELARQGRLDVLPAVMKSAQREQYLSFTSPYLNFPMVIITRADGVFVAGLDDLVGKRVAVVRSYVTQDILEANHSELDLVLVENNDAGLQAVALGEVSAYVGNLAAISHAIAHLGLTNLKVAAPTPYSYPLSMGVRKDWPELVSILDKALASIGPEQARAIRDRWMSVQLEQSIDPVALAKKLAPLILTIAAVFMVIIVWNRRLRHEVKERKRVEDALRINEERLDLAMSVTNDGLFDWDIITNNVYFSPRYYTMAGYEAGEFPGIFEEWAKRVFPEDFVDTEDAVKAYLAGEIPEYDQEFRFKRKDDEWMWIRARVKVVERDEGGSPLRIIGTHTDITTRKQAEESLIASEARFRSFFQNNSSVMLLTEPSSGKIIDANEAASDYYDLPKEKLLSMSISSINTLPSEAIARERRRARREGRSHLIFKHRIESGEERDVEVHSTPIYSDGRPLLFCIVHDITERKRAEEKLVLAVDVFRHAREGIMITDADNNIIDVNDAFLHITGYNRKEVLGQNPRILSSGLYGTEFYAGMWREIGEQGHWHGEIWNRRKNGDLYLEMLTISSIVDEQGKARHFVALFTDITEQKAQQKQLEHMAHYDALTNLANRVLLADHLHQSIAQTHRHKRQLAVAYIDLDGFKAINDSHGHEVGDQLLITLASRMKQALRDGDTIARLGGDEFVAVLNELPDTKASVPLLNRLLEVAANPVNVGDLVLQVSSSIGVTFYPQTEDVDADQLLRQADQAMYQAKLAGKSRYHVFDAEEDRNVRGHHESLEHIRHALDERQFVLYY
ncbi:MAG: PAS domain S-box protein, partial [Pseudomonadota bacterium]